MAASQGSVFSDVQPIVAGVLDGFNATLLSYGYALVLLLLHVVYVYASLLKLLLCRATGAGKTYTILGKAEQRGILQRYCSCRRAMILCSPVRHV